MAAATPCADLPAPPYSPEIEAKGWTFDVQVARLFRSDTWTLAPADVRPWLLMLWVSSWHNAPVGTYPDDDRIIAARIGMPDAHFALQRGILLRGWQKHADGRLYHPVITELVLAMIAKRTADRVRQARHLENQESNKINGAAQKITRENGVSAGDSHSPHYPLPPTPLPKSKGRKDKAPAFAAADLLADLPADLAEEWIEHRRRKRAPLTRAAWDGIKAEAARAGWTPEQAVRKALARGWTGFEAEWVQPGGRQINGHGKNARPLTRGEAIDARNAEAAEEWLSRHGQGGNDAAS